MQFVLDRIKQMNVDDLESGCIKKSFENFRVNPWYSNLESFEDHLSGLNENKIYKALLDKNNKIDIDSCLVDAAEIRKNSK